MFYKIPRINLIIPVITFFFSIIGSLFSMIESQITFTIAMFFNFFMVPIYDNSPIIYQKLSILRLSDKPLLTPVGIIVIGFLFSLFLFIIIFILNRILIFVNKIISN